MFIEDFVTYEQALALKKLGFDEVVNHYYKDNKLFESATNNDECATPAYTSYNNFNIDWIFPNNICSAPTLAQVQKWLRKKHIEIIITPELDYLYHRKSYKGYADCDKRLYSNDSYEKLLSKIITECLEQLLKNDKIG